MASLMDLEFDRDNLVEQIMAAIEAETTEGVTDSALILQRLDELEAQIADKVEIKILYLAVNLLLAELIPPGGTFGFVLICLGYNNSAGTILHFFALLFCLIP